MDEAHLGRNSARQSGLEHRFRFRQRVGTNHAGDVQADFGILEVIELRQNRLERLLCDRARRHPIDADLHHLQPGILQFLNQFARQEKSIRGQAGGKPEFAAVANELDHIGCMSGSPPTSAMRIVPRSRIFRIQIFRSSRLGCGRLVVVFGAIRAIEVALVRQIKTALQRFAIENALTGFQACCSRKIRGRFYRASFMR